MQSTFHGLETARRALMTQQYALRTVGHNIANANSPGYSRQRVNFEQTEPYPANGINRPRLPGHLGTGVKAGSIQRVREHFLDTQYRNETNKVGYWNARLASYTKMEDILIETEDQGLNYQINLFWTSLQDLALDPEDSGARAVVRERGKFIAETFNYYHMSLSEIKNDYKAEIEDAQKQINIILQSIEEINDQIRRTEPHGYVPNDLYDRQDMLLDQLSNFVNIKVTREESGGKPSPVAEGPVTVMLVNDVGEPYYRVDENGQAIKDSDGNPIPLNLIDGTGEQKPLELKIGFNDDGYVEKFTFVDETNVDEANPNPLSLEIDLNKMPRGEMKALIEAYGYKKGEENGEPVIEGVYPNMINELNHIAKKFVEEFNNIHKLGFTLATENSNPRNEGDFFTIADVDDPSIDSKNPAAAIRVDDNILNSLDNIAAAGVNIDALDDTTPKSEFAVDGVDLTARQYYEHLMSQTSIDYSALHTLLTNTDNFKDDVSVAYAGDSANAHLLAGLKDMLINFGDDTNKEMASISSYYQGVFGEMAVAAQESFGKLESATSIQLTVENNRQSVSSVSLDEEFTLMIQYQHAYNAAARNITMVDEMLDRIINNMGIVGR